LREECRLRVFEEKVLRRIFGLRREEETGEWRRLHNKKLHALYSSPDIIRVVKSRSLRWAEHVAHIRARRGGTGFWWENLRKGDHLENPDVDGRIILKCIFEKLNDCMNWIDLVQYMDRWRAVVNAVMILRIA
jgi:hypothetical protein